MVRNEIASTKGFRFTIGLSVLKWRIFADNYSSGAGFTYSRDSENGVYIRVLTSGKDKRSDIVNKTLVHPTSTIQNH